MKQFIDRHTWMLPLAVVAVGFAALIGVFAVAPGSPMRAPEPAPVVVFEPDPASEPAPVEESEEAYGFDCDSYMPALLRINAEIAELDIESSSAGSEIARLNRELADLMEQADAAGCV